MVGSKKSNSQTKSIRKSHLPPAPWLVISTSPSVNPDAQTAYVKAIQAMLPYNECTFMPRSRPCSDLKGESKATSVLKDQIDQELSLLSTESIQILIFQDEQDKKAGDKNMVDTIHDLKWYRLKAIEKGINFVHVHIWYSGKEKDDYELAHGKIKWPVPTTHRLEQFITYSYKKQTAIDVKEWLLKTLTVPETLYLYSEAEMKAVCTKTFKDYTYCAIADSNKHAKDAKIQFIGIVLAKPELQPCGKKASWSVIDKTGQVSSPSSLFNLFCFNTDTNPLPHRLDSTSSTAAPKANRHGTG